MTDTTGHEAERAGDSGWLDLNDVAPEPARFDLDAIADRLRRQAEHWVPQLFPNGRRVGDEWRLANIEGSAPRKSGSCIIALAGPNAGDWYDFDASQGGGPLSTLENATGHSGRALYAYAAELVGWTSDRPAKANGAAGPPRTDSARDPAREIAFIVDHTVPIAGTVAENYLAA
jgi:putative DNA primase/helicase